MLNIIILKTNVSTKNGVEKFTPKFKDHTSIDKWNIDIEDVDNVLRIESNDDTSEKQFINWLKSIGITAYELED